MCRISSKENPLIQCRVTPRNSNIRLISRPDQHLVNRNGILLTHAPKNSIYRIFGTNALRVRLEWEEHMSSPRINLILRNNRATEPAAALTKKENVPKLPLLLQAGQVTRFEMNKEDIERYRSTIKCDFEVHSYPTVCAITASHIT